MRKLKVLILITSICSVLLCSGSIFLLKTKSDQNIVSAYTFSSESGQYFGNKNNVNYNGYTVFYINSPNGLLNFSMSVANGCDFSGKEVRLTSNIDWSGYGNYPPIGASMDSTEYSSIEPFKGYFDGQGHTIKNLTTRVESRGALITDVYFGLFALLEDGATVCNVRVQNSNYILEDFNIGLLTINVDCGGIAAKSDGAVSIYNCYIENLNVTNNNDHSDAIIGASGIVATCYSRNVDTSNLSTARSLTVSDVIFNGFTKKGNGSVIFSAETPLFSWAYAGSGPLSGGWQGGYWKFSNIIRNCSGYSMIGDASNIPSENVYDEPNMTSGFDCDSIGGVSGTTWYYCEEYNDGWPMLRMFMSWETITFNSEDANKGRVSPSSIYIPSDAFANYSSYSSNVSTSSATLMIYDQRIQASSQFGYVFDRWESSISTSAVSYTAYFTETTMKIIFVKIAECLELTSLSFPSSDVYEISVKTGEEFKVYCDHSNKNYTKIVYEIGSDRKVTYKFPKKYTVKSYGEIIFDMGILGVNTIIIGNGTIVPDLTLVGLDSFTIYPTIQLKTYNSNFQ